MSAISTLGCCLYFGQFGISVSDLQLALIELIVFLTVLFIVLEGHKKVSKCVVLQSSECNSIANLSLTF